jgi:hypothetical protein
MVPALSKWTIHPSDRIEVENGADLNRLRPPLLIRSRTDPFHAISPGEVIHPSPLGLGSAVPSALSMAVEMDLRVGFVGVLKASGLDSFLGRTEPLEAPQVALPTDPAPQARHAGLRA